MKKKALWMGLSSLLVVALLLSSCANKTTTNALTTSTPTSTTNVNEPKYGGTLTYMNNFASKGPVSFDAQYSNDFGATSVWVNPYLEWLTCGDIEKYGPRGNNTFAFQLEETTPEEYLGGVIAESWEINFNQFTFHLRHGIMFTGNSNIGMAARELTADDVVFNLNRSKNRPFWGGIFMGFVNSDANAISATDRYTVVIQCKFDGNWPFFFGSGFAWGAIMAPESVTAGADDWKHAVGTGPFMITDYVEGSEATYTVNPNYWGKTTINGKQYQTPFIQTLKYPIIPDQSTELANLRTGKLDWDPKVSLVNQDTLNKSSPALIQDKWLSGVVTYFKLSRIDSPIFSKKEVRQAMMIATDFNNIAKAVYIDGEVYAWPLGKGAEGFVPFDQLPQADQLLYTYDPTKAQQMLADAGYPQGFKMDLVVNNTSEQMDLATLCSTMWAKVGVTVNIKSMDDAARDAVQRDPSTYTAVSVQASVVNPLVALALGRTDSPSTTFKPEEPFNAAFLKISETTDPVTRIALIQQDSIAMLDDAGFIPFANPYTLNCHWPWVKNYYGEIEAGYYNAIPMIKTLWIDQTLKNSLGQ